MKHQSIKTLLRRSVLVAAMLALVAGSASAATYTLRAGTTTVDYGNGPVTAWGYAMVNTNVPGVIADNIVKVPGPTLYVPAGDLLTINFINGLSEPTSLVIHGQKLVGTPQFSGGRVTAFTTEAPPGGSTPIGEYTWASWDLKPGTYLYSSGSHPAKQVHMGLYGALVVDADPASCAPGTGAFAAYPGVCYDRDIVVILSEVDTDLRTALAAAKPLNFKPNYFLVNGDPTGDSVLTDNGATPDPATLNSRVLLRVVNAGLKNYSPTLLGEDLEWIAEDGNPYPHVRRSYSAFLGAGKTMDAIWVPVTEDRHPLYDRRNHMTTNGYPHGGLRAFLDSTGADVPLAIIGTPATDLVHQDVWTTVGVDSNTIAFDGSTSSCSGAPGCSYEWTLVGFPVGASQANLTDNLDGTATLSLGISGTYSVQLVVTDIATSQTSAAAIRNVFTNLPPVADAGADQAVDTGAVVNLDGSASYDPDTAVHGDAITFAWVLTPPAGSAAALNDPTAANPSFTADLAGDYEAVLTVSDGELTDTDAMTVTASVHVNQPPEPVNDYFDVQWKTDDNPLNVLGNDSDPDGSLDQSTLTIVTDPIISGASSVVVDETSPGSGIYVVYYTPKNGFKGTDFFTYSICDDGAPVECSEAEVWVNVIK